MNKYKICSLFAGIGGIELGFSKKFFKLVFANEIDKYACRTYRLNFDSKILVEADVCDLKIDMIPEFDILIAGFPCQSFSSVGLQNGFNDTRGTLFFEILKILEAKKPSAFLLENVANLIKHDCGKTFLVIKNSLEEIGYSVRYKIMNSCDYGIPQQRNRIYIVGFLNKNAAANFKFPKSRKLKHNAFYFLDKEKQPESYYLDKHKKIKEINQQVTNNKKIYRFTDWGISSGREGICPTLLAAMGSSFERIPFFRDAYSIRKLTQHECARLQGFPKNFKFDFKAPKQVYKQIGNSVCVPIIKLLSKEIKKQLDGEVKYD